MKNSFIALSSPFPVDHRIIFSWPVLQWPKHGDAPGDIGVRLAKAVEHILSLHPHSRGLIHSVSYDRRTLLLNNCNTPRLFTHGSGEGEFDNAIARLAATEAAVLVSPRALEGLDLKNDHSEFQIFIKLPFANLGDSRIKQRSDIDRRYYPLITAMNIVQGSGRSVRNMDDIAPTYILDAFWLRWYPANYSLFPQYFRDAVRRFNPLNRHEQQYLSEISH